MISVPNSKDISRGAFWSLSNQFFGQVLILLVFLVTARFLTKEQFGVMAICMMFVEILRQILIDGIATTIFAKKDPSDQFYNAAFTLLVTGGACATLFLILAASSIAELLNEPQITLPLQLLAPLVILLSLSKAQETRLSKGFRFKSLALRSAASVMIGGAVGIWMAVNEYGVFSLVTQQILTAVISLAWLWSACDWKPQLTIDRQSLKSVFKTSAHVSMNNSISVIGGQSDVFFTSLYLGAVSTGVFNAGKRILTAVHLIVSSGLNSVAFPLLASLGKDHPEIQNTFIKCVVLTSFLTAPLYAGLIILSPELVYVLLGEKWMDAAPVISILAITGFSFSLTQYATNIFLIFDKPKLLTSLSFINGLLNIVLLFLFARFGLIPLVTGLACVMIIIVPLAFGLALKLLQIHFMTLIRQLIPSIFSALVMSCVVLMLKATIELLHPVFVLTISVCVGMGIYLLCAYFTDQKNFRLLWGSVTQR